MNSSTRLKDSFLISSLLSSIKEKKVISLIFYFESTIYQYNITIIIIASLAKLLFLILIRSKENFVYSLDLQNLYFVIWKDI